MDPSSSKITQKPLKLLSLWDLTRKITADEDKMIDRQNLEGDDNVARLAAMRSLGLKNRPSGSGEPGEIEPFMRQPNWLRFAVPTAVPTAVHFPRQSVWPYQDGDGGMWGQGNIQKTLQREISRRNLDKENIDKENFDKENTNHRNIDKENTNLRNLDKENYINRRNLDNENYINLRNLDNENYINLRNPDNEKYINRRNLDNEIYINLRNLNKDNYINLRNLDNENYIKRRILDKDYNRGNLDKEDKEDNRIPFLDNAINDKSNLPDDNHHEDNFVYNILRNLEATSLVQKKDLSRPETKLKTTKLFENQLQVPTRQSFLVAMAKKDRETVGYSTSQHDAGVMEKMEEEKEERPGRKKDDLNKKDNNQSQKEEWKENIRKQKTMENAVALAGDARGKRSDAVNIGKIKKKT